MERFAHPKITHYVHIDRPTGVPYLVPAYVAQDHLHSAVTTSVNGQPIRAGDHLAAKTSRGWEKFDHVRKQWRRVTTTSAY